jgi:Flp pilus assembly protein TadB
VGLTPKRVNRVLDRWDEITAPAHETYFNAQLIFCAIVAVVCVVVGAWWLAVLFLALTLVCVRLLWERPHSRLRRLSDRIVRRHDA